MQVFNKDFYDKYAVSESSVRTVIDRFKKNMDLEYGPEYQDFTKKVQSFCKKYKGLGKHFEDFGSLYMYKGSTDLKDEYVKANDKSFNELLTKSKEFIKSYNKTLSSLSK